MRPAGPGGHPQPGRAAGGVPAAHAHGQRPSPAFATGTGFNDYVYAVAVQADGKVLVGGNFTSYNGTSGQNRLIRLNADGSPRRHLRHRHRLWSNGTTGS